MAVSWRASSDQPEAEWRRARPPGPMTGHNPHRIEGKAKDAERQHGERRSNREDAERGLPSEKQVAERGPGEPSRFEAEEQMGGSRPGMESRVKDAIGRREAREEKED